MPEVELAPVIMTDPEMTMDHKAQLLLHQRQQLTCQLTIYRLQQQLDQMPATLNVLLNNICKDLKIDPNGYTFDLDNLKIIYKGK